MLQNVCGHAETGDVLEKIQIIKIHKCVENELEGQNARRVQCA
jgi:hypothetical protein